MSFSYVISDVNMSPLTADDRLLIRILRIEKGWTVDRMITEFPARELVYRQKITDIEHLKRVLVSCWDTISQELINGAIDQWSKQLSLFIHAHGGRIEHHFR